MKNTLSHVLFFVAIFSSAVKAAYGEKRINLFDQKTPREESIPREILTQNMNCLSLDETLTLGQRALLLSCKDGSIEHVQKMMEEKIDTNFLDPETNLTPFMLALHGKNKTNKAIALLLLKHGAKPHAFLPADRSVYSQSFSEGDHAAIQFLLKNHVPYSTKKQHAKRSATKKRDLERLLIAGNFDSLAQAFVSGLLLPQTITLEALTLARRLKENNPHFNERILPLLNHIFNHPRENFTRLKRRLFLLSQNKK